MFQVRIFTPQRQDAIEASHVTLPAYDGEWGIRTGHLPFVCLLIPGRLLVRDAEGDRRYRIGHGVAHIEHDVMEIYTETATEE